MPNGTGMTKEQQVVAWGMVTLGTLLAGYVVFFLEATLLQRLLAFVIVAVLWGGVAAIYQWWRGILGSLPVVGAGAVGLVGAGFAAWAVLLEAGFYGPGTKALPDSLKRPLTAESLKDPGQRNILLTFAGDTTQMRFDSVTHGQSDRNMLDSLGTRGLIVPADGVHNIEFSDLEPGKGRILWRVSITGDRGYPRLGLPPGVSYIVVDNLIRVENFDSATAGFVKRYREHPHHAHDTLYAKIIGVARALVVPEDIKEPVRTGRVIVKQHLGYWWNRPIAKWVGPGSHDGWGDCSTHGCCEWCVAAC